jgi:hypothetical protein
MNRITLLVIMASLLVTHNAAFATAAFATPLSRELASDSVTLRKHGSVYRDGWVRWLGWSGAGWGFVGPGGGKGWMGNGWGWRGVGPTLLRSMSPATTAAARFQSAEVGQAACPVDLT